MTEAKTFGRRILAATPDEVVRAEQTSSRDERFRRVDELAAALLTASFSGREIVKVEREPVPKTSLVANTVRLAPVVEDQGALLAESFAVKSHQARGAWWLPDDASLKVGLLNLPASFVQGRRFAYGIARDDQVKVALASTPDAVAVWALLQPLFATLLAPIELRSQSAGTLAPEEAKKTWAGLEDALANLGLDVADKLAVLRYGSGWSRLKAEEQRQAKVAFVARLAPQVGIEITKRFRAMRVCELVARYYAKATRAAPTQRQVLTRPRGQILAAHFGGDWLAFLDYLEEAPAPGEEIMTALPEARLYATGSERVKEVAAAKGLSPQDVEAMLASFYGEGSLRTPVERRVEVLRRCWAEVDAAHAVQAPGMPALGKPYQHDVQRSMFSGDVLADIDAFWDGECLPRWPERIVSSTDPLASMAATFGPALAFWHEIGINAWSLTEGPYTPNSLEGLAGLAAFHRGDLETLAEAGCPVDRVLFDELTVAEAKLGPPTEITNVLSEDEAVPGISLTISETLGTRRNGFEILRDIVTRYRRQWAADHLERYLRWRWESELRQVAWEHSRWLAAKGKAPTLKQFAKIAAPAANRWFGGDIADLFGAFGERPPARAGRVRLMPANREALVHLVWKGLGGEVLEDEAAWREPERFQRQWTHPPPRRRSTAIRPTPGGVRGSAGAKGAVRTATVAGGRGGPVAALRHGHRSSAYRGSSRAGFGTSAPTAPPYTSAPDWGSGQQADASEAERRALGRTGACARRRCPPPRAVAGPKTFRALTPTLMSTTCAAGRAGSSITAFGHWPARAVVGSVNRVDSSRGASEAGPTRLKPEAAPSAFDGDVSAVHIRPAMRSPRVAAGCPRTTARP